MSVPPLRSPREPGQCEVQVQRVGTGFHVDMCKGMLTYEEWGQNPYHRRGLWGAIVSCARYMSGISYRRQFPKTEKALRKAIAECEICCRLENEAELAAEALLRRTEAM